MLRARAVPNAAGITTRHQRGPRRVGLVVLKLAGGRRHPVYNQPPVGGPHQPHGAHGAPHAHCGNPALGQFAVDPGSCSASVTVYSSG